MMTTDKKTLKLVILGLVFLACLWMINTTKLPKVAPVELNPSRKENKEIDTTKPVTPYGSSIREDMMLYEDMITSSSKSQMTLPIVIATSECYTPNSLLVRNLLFSISRYTTKEHPVRFYITHTYDKKILPNPLSILCQNLTTKCDDLLQFLHTEKHIDVRFAPVVNNSFVTKFKPCASSQLWFAEVMPHERQVIFLNRDMIVRQDLYSMWSLFTLFSKDEAYALSYEFVNVAPEVKFKSMSPYRSSIEEVRGPFWARPYGLNTGMVLYHLENIRQARTIEDWEYLIDQGVGNPYAEQDVINYYSTQQPFRYRTLPCKWNYRDHCNSSLSDAGIIHGSVYIFEHANNFLNKHYEKDKMSEDDFLVYFQKKYQKFSLRVGPHGFNGKIKELMTEFLKNNFMLLKDKRWNV